MRDKERLDPSDSITIVKEYFINNFSKYKIGKEGIYMGYWWIEYYDDANNLKVYFDGDVGGHFHIKIYLKEDEYFLWQYDKKVNQMTKSTRQNLLNQLKILNQFLNNS